MILRADKDVTEEIQRIAGEETLEDQVQRENATVALSFLFGFH